MWKFLISINKKLIYAIPVMIVIGFIFGKSVSADTVKQLKSLIVPMTFLMVYPMMVTLNIKSLKDGIKNVKLQLTTQFINFFIVPFLAYASGLWFFFGQQLYGPWASPCSPAAHKWYDNIMDRFCQGKYGCCY